MLDFVVRAVEAEEKVVVADIIGAKPRHRTVRTQAGTQMVPAGFTVFYACKKKSPKWREKRIYFDHIDINVCRRWAAQIEIMAKGEILRAACTGGPWVHFCWVYFCTNWRTLLNVRYCFVAGSSSRPKMLKVFVNPAAGKKNGVRIFEQEIAPILKICDVRCEVTGLFSTHSVLTFSPLMNILLQLLNSLVIYVNLSSRLILTVMMGIWDKFRGKIQLDMQFLCVKG